MNPLALIPWLAALATGLQPNLVANPNLRQGVYDPDAWALNRPFGNRVEWVTDRRDVRQAALRLTGSGTDWAGATSSQVQVKPGQRLALAAWIRRDDVGSDRDRVYVRFFAPRGFIEQQGPAVPSTGGRWQLVSAVVTAPAEAATADVSVQVVSSGTLLFGGAALVAGGSVADAEALLDRPALADPVPVVGPRGLAPDRNRNGLPDVLESRLAIPQGARSARLTRRNTTSLQTHLGYLGSHDLKVDTILVVNETPEALKGWKAMGYRTPFMAGFRAGPDYLQAHPGSAQTDRSGRPLDCGPGSYYMVPTPDRLKVMRDQFERAGRNGAEGAAPEEPEFFGRGAYAPAFKDAFLKEYGRPWVDPSTSIQARVDCQRLMGKMEIDLLRACYDGVRAGNPRAEKWMLVHSPVNYGAWNVAFPFWEAITALKPDHMVAQVWTGTAQSGTAHQGVRRARTFENAWLEYSSSLNLVRGTRIKPWLLMDPLEDAPGRPMSEYFDCWRRTLCAALMFPESDRFEVLPWPARIFGQVPDDFATVITSVINALSDLQNHPIHRHDRGPDGIATFLADSAMWQREPPNESDFDTFYGLSLPLVMRGVPVQVASLDRAAEPGYLKPYRVLLVSFDAMKPQRKADVDALAAWVRAGGHMILCGGDDAYNGLGLWWKQEGFASPHDYLLHALGLRPGRTTVLERSAPSAPYRVATRTSYTGRLNENRSVVALDLTRDVAKTGAAYLRFTDTVPADGWGPWIAGIEVRGTRNGKPFRQLLRPGTASEGAAIAADTGSGVSGMARYVDGSRELVYRLEFDAGTAAEARVDLGNQYCIEVAPAPAREPIQTLRVAGSRLGAMLDPAACETAGRAIVSVDQSGSQVLTTPRGALVWEAQVGKGGVVVTGLPSLWFTRTTAADRFMRRLVEYSCGRAGVSYREQDHMGIERGPYVVVRAFGKPAPVAVETVDLMTAGFALRKPGPVPPDGLVVLKRLPTMAGAAPMVVAGSDCIEWSSRTGRELRLVASNAAGIKSSLRVMTGGRPISVTATDAFGAPKPVRVTPQGKTALLRYDAETQGVGLRIVAR